MQPAGLRGRRVEGSRAEEISSVAGKAGTAAVPGIGVDGGGGVDA